MKTHIVPPHPIEQLLADPRSDLFFGQAFVIKCEVLALLMTGQGSLAAIARKHQVSGAALSRHARRAKEIYGLAHKQNVKELTVPDCSYGNGRNTKTGDGKT